MSEPIRPNTLADPARQGRGRPVANRLTGMLEAGSRARLPGISGRWSAVLLLVLFVAAAVILPLALHRTAWVEAEIVVGTWFLIWTGVLTWLGYTGRMVEEDWGPFRGPRPLVGRRSTGSDAGAVPYFDLGGIDVPDVGGDGELGCLGVIVAVVAMIAAAALIVVLLYLTIGYLIPLLALALYTIVRAMLNHVAARGHVTRGNLPASLARGAFWAGVYTAPLAVAIWAIHVVV